jgi:PAS domain S-box-containing protein
MGLKYKLLYYFHPDIDKQEQALFISLTVTFFISIYLIYAHTYRDITILIYAKSLFLFINTVFLWLFIQQRVSTELLSKTFMVLLFLFLTFDIAFTLSKIEAVLIFIFYPITALMICKKKNALISIALFLIVNITLHILGPSSLNYTFFETIDTLMGVLIFVTIIGFYITSFERNQQRLNLKNRQIKQQHKLLANIFDKAPLFYSSFTDEGHLSYVSDYELRLLRKLRENVLGLHFKEIYKEHPKLLLNLSLLNSKDENNFILKLYDKTFDFRCSNQYDQKRNYIGFSMIAFDISEQIQTKLELQESKDRLGAITEVAFEAIISEGFSIIQGNRKAHEMFGYEKMSDIMYKDLQKFVTEKSAKVMVENITKGNEEPYLIYGVKQDGSTFPMEVKGKTIEYFGQTLRVSAIQSLDSIDKAKKEISKLAQVVEQNSSLIMISNPDGIIEYVNQAFVDTMGYSKEEMIGQKPRVISSGHHNEDFYDGWQAYADLGKVWSKEMNNRTKDGEIITVKNNISAIKDSAGTITHYLSMQEDVTQLKEKERMYFAQTKQAQMGEMLSMIAHQWRQPLSAISVIAAKMRFGIELEHLDLNETKNNLELIDKQVQFLSETIDDFRNFFKPDKRAETIFAQDLIHKATSIISKQIEIAEAELIVDHSNNPKFTSYQNELVQVLLSLMKNSLDQMQNATLAKKEIRIGVQETRHECIISVCDSAGGIPQEIINDIFLPYFSTKNEKQGTGLGLHMCKTIVEDHCRGSIVAENHDDGVCFFITLPLH